MGCERLAIPGAVVRQVIAHAREALPNECCGLLAGRVDGGAGVAADCFPIGNDAASPNAYLTNPGDLFRAFRAMRARDLDLLAVYHSHPGAAPVPSRRDLAENTYGDSIVHVIVGFAGDEVAIRAWRLRYSATVLLLSMTALVVLPACGKKKSADDEESPAPGGPYGPVEPGMPAHPGPGPHLRYDTRTSNETRSKLKLIGTAMHWYQRRPAAVPGGRQPVQAVQARRAVEQRTQQEAHPDDAEGVRGAGDVDERLHLLPFVRW
jgi:proteasome lid subunit RPN8/RPN11